MTRHRVLVVEDDPDIRASLIDLLDENGCEVVGAANGALALKHLKGADPLPCLILLDLMMPVMDGPAFRQEQLKDPRIAHIPIVVISAFREVAADELRMARFIKKPPRLEELITAVAQYC